MQIMPLEYQGVPALFLQVGKWFAHVLSICHQFSVIVPTKQQLFEQTTTSTSTTISTNTTTATTTTATTTNNKKNKNKELHYI